MGTPVELLDGSPPAPTIAHEVGHLVISLELNRTGSILFHRDGDVIGGVTHNSNRLLGGRDIAMRALAGIVMQSILLPRSVADELRTKVTTGSLFKSSACLKDESPEHRAMRAHFAWTDWDIIREQKLGRSKRSQLVQMHSDLLAFCALARTRRLADAFFEDISNWLQRDDEDCYTHGQAWYPGGRAIQVFDAHPKPHDQPPLSFDIRKKHEEGHDASPVAS